MTSEGTLVANIPTAGLEIRVLPHNNATVPLCACKLAFNKLESSQQQTGSIMTQEYGSSYDCDEQIQGSYVV